MRRERLRDGGVVNAELMRKEELFKPSLSYGMVWYSTATVSSAAENNDPAQKGKFFLVCTSARV